MPDKRILAELEESIKYWINQRDVLHKKLADINTTIGQLEVAYHIMSKKEKELASPSPTLTKPLVGPNATIGDAMEAILTESRKPLTKDEIIEQLRLRGVGISLRNPKVVLSIAILRDKKQRFKTLDDGRVKLAEKKQGNE
jgi:hypothetical protein